MQELVYQELRITRFPSRNIKSGLYNITEQCMFFGDVRSRFFGSKTPSKYNKIYRELYEYLQYMIRSEHPGFQYTTVQVCKNTQYSPAIDKYNYGPSLAIGLGNYTGGSLVIEGIRNNIRKRWLNFDGSAGRWDTKADGDRYVIIYYTTIFGRPRMVFDNTKVFYDGVFNNGRILRSYIV